MSDESRIDPELKKLEAQLQGIGLPNPKVDRDRVLYQSGWAAAMATVERGGSPPVSVHPRKSSRLIWPTASMIGATAAAILGVLLFLQTQQIDLLQGEMARIRNTAIPNPIELASDAPTENQSLNNPESPETQHDRSLAANDGADQQRPVTTTYIERVDLIKKVWELPSRHVLTTSILRPGYSAVVRFEHEIDQNGSDEYEPVKTNREMIDEMLSDLKRFGT